MVTISLPSARVTLATHERIASPLRCTTQAPHCATPHPYFVPFNFATSRIAHNKGIWGSTSSLYALPLILHEMTAMEKMFVNETIPTTKNNPFPEKELANDDAGEACEFN